MAARSIEPVLVASLLVLPGLLAAAEAPVEVLPEVVVTATGDSQDPATLPIVSQSVESEEMRTRRAVRTLPQALSEVPAIAVQQTAHGQESPYIRGFTGFRTLLLVDGVRVNNATFRDGPNQYWGLVDPLAIGRVEVVKGPSSVLHGSDAIGGTVNALTPEEFAEGIHPGAYYRFASAERSHTARADLLGEQGKLGYFGGVTWRDYGDLSGGRLVGEQDGTGYESLSGDARASYRLSPALILSAAFQSTDQFDVPRTHSTVDGLSWHGTIPGTDLRRDLTQERRFGYVRAELTPEADLLRRVSMTISYQLLAEEEDRIRSNGVQELQGFEDHTLGAQVSAETPTPFGDWTYGVEWYGDWIEDSFRKDFAADGSLISVRPRGPVADDSRYDSVGVFIQDLWQPVERLTLIAGARYNFHHAEASASGLDPDATDAVTFEDLDEDFHSVVGSGRALFQLTEHLSPFAGVSQGFRAPNLSDLTRFDAARSSEREVPATDLEPEYYVSVEGGLRWGWERLGGTVSYFYTDIEDMILRTPTGETTPGGEIIVSKDNIGDGYLHGVELGFDWRFIDELTAFGAFSFTDGRVDTFVDGVRKEMKPISRLPPVQGLLGLRWEPRDAAGAPGPWWVESTLRLVYAQDRLSPDDKLDTQRIPPGGSPGYYLLGLRGGTRIGKRVRLFAGVENITDQDYRVHGSGVNGPGISFVGGIEARL